MSNLKLVPDAPTPLEKLLLDASRAEQPSEDHKARLRAALGIGLPMSGPLAAAPLAASAPPGQPATGSPAVARSASRALTWGKVVLGVAAVALVGAFWLTRQPDAAPVPVVSLVAPAHVVAPAPTVTPVLVAQEAAPAVSPLPPIEQPSATPRVAHGDAANSGNTADLSEQIRLIESARAGVAAHDAKAALSALNAYGAKFPHGSFGQEAMVLRIRAIDLSGDSARATALAKSFVARFPSSPHVARLKPIAERSTSR